MNKEQAQVEATNRYGPRAVVLEFRGKFSVGLRNRVPRSPEWIGSGKSWEDAFAAADKSPRN